MNKLAIITFIAVAIHFFIILHTPPSKSYYHSLFISPSFCDNASIANHLRILTHRPHVAGTQANLEAADYVLSILNSYNIPTHITSYQASLTYPVSRSLVLQPNHSDPPIVFDLIQEIYDGDLYADVADQVMPTFHAYAKSGNVTAPVVYVNYGRLEDYETLREMGVNVSGCIVLAKHGKLFRGSIVINAMEAGAVGAVLYSDRKDFCGGYGNESLFPDGKWMPLSGVQVGLVYNGSGDPTTPGWPSTEGCERLTDEEVENGGDVPRIPSLPISAADGERIIKSIAGPVAKEDWQGSNDAPVYRVGPGPGVLNLSYSGNSTIATIYNVIGVIEGREEPDRLVILGNHRDAWTFGAVDPNSGTAALLEVAQRLKKLQRMGWRPRRTIILCNWDAEEYGLIGSTEWVEENKAMLSSRAVAYLNVDVGVEGGPGFLVDATPQLDRLLIDATKKVLDPDNSSQTVYETLIGPSNSSLFGRLGGGRSDYAAFVQHIGVPAADMTFGDGVEYPVYHSMYDDFTWMTKFGDPMFHRHVAVASVWGLLALRLADDEILPFSYLPYADELQKSAKDLQDEVTGKDVSLAPMFKSIEKFKEAAAMIESQKKKIEETKGWLSKLTRSQTNTRELNDRLMMAERAFLDPNGLFGRPWSKHLVYAPSKHDRYGSKSFPGIDDAIRKAKSVNSRKSWQSVQHEIWRVARVIEQASLVLSGILT